MTDEDAQKIAEAVVAKLDTLPRDLKDVVQLSGQYAVPIPTKTPANYGLLKVICDADGLWIVLEVNNYRLYERKFFYSDEYAFPANRR